MAIAVEEITPTTYRVTVSGASVTEHEVNVDPLYAEEISPDEPIDSLLRRSFEFLLEREPNTSILARFDLRVISRYFPEYERVIAER